MTKISQYLASVGASRLVNKARGWPDSEYNSRAHQSSCGCFQVPLWSGLLDALPEGHVTLTSNPSHAFLQILPAVCSTVRSQGQEGEADIWHHLCSDWWRDSSMMWLFGGHPQGYKYLLTHASISPAKLLVPKIGSWRNGLLWSIFGTLWGVWEVGRCLLCPGKGH